MGDVSFNRLKANEISIWPNSKGGKRGKSGDGDPDIARVISKSFFVDRFREHEGTRLILFFIIYAMIIGI